MPFTPRSLQSSYHASVTAHLSHLGFSTCLWCAVSNKGQASPVHAKCSKVLEEYWLCSNCSSCIPPIPFLVEGQFCLGGVVLDLGPSLTYRCAMSSLRLLEDWSPFSEGPRCQQGVSPMACWIPTALHRPWHPSPWKPWYAAIPPSAWALGQGGGERHPTTALGLNPTYCCVRARCYAIHPAPRNGHCVCVGHSL